MIILLQLPFLNQAFHIDDNIYLLLADNTRQQPFFPQDLCTYFEGLKVDNFFSHEHPLLLSSWLLAPALFQTSVSAEVAAHGLFQTFLFMLVSSTYLLSRNLTKYPGTAAFLCALSPVVYLSSHKVMLDLPFVSLVYAAMAVFRLELLKKWSYQISGLCIAIASMVAYQTVFFIPVTFLVAPQRGWKRLWIVLPAVITLLVYALVNSLYLGRFIWLDLFDFWIQQPASAGGTPAKSLHSLLTILGAVVFPAAWILMICIRWDFLRRFLGHPEGRLLAGVFLTNVFLLAVLYHVGACRYWLPAAPAICIFLIALIEYGVEGGLRNALLIAVLTTTGIVSVFLAHADLEWSGFYRRSSAMVDDYRREGSEVWIAGEWGFRWYFTRRGARLLGRADVRPKAGDVVVRPALASPYLTAYDSAENFMVLEETVPFNPSTPIRLLDFDSHAGFYSFGWGLLPYSLSRSRTPLEQLFIYRVLKTPPAPEKVPTYWDWNR